MKTEFKVLLYLKRNGQGKDGLCPLMGRIMIKATGNSTTQFGCKIRVDPKLWNATSQRCTGKKPDGHCHQQGNRQDDAPAAKEIQRTGGNQR